MLDIFDLGEHVRDGLWRVDGAGVGDVSAAREVAFAGEPSAILGARLVLAAAAARLKPVTLGDVEPGDGAVVLSASYDGHDAAALEALAAARRSGRRCIVATTGGPLAAAAREAGCPVIPLPAGFTASSAIGYWIAFAAEILALAGAVPSLRAELEAGAEAVEHLVARWSAEGDAAAPMALAAALRDARSVVLLDSSPLARRVADRLLTEAGLPVAIADSTLLDALPEHLLARLVEGNGARLAALAPPAGRDDVLLLATEAGSAVERTLSTILLVDITSHHLGSRAGVGA